MTPICRDAYDGAKVSLEFGENCRPLLFFIMSSYADKTFKFVDVLLCLDIYNLYQNVS